LTIWKEQWGKKIGVTIARELLEKGRAGVLQGFKSKSGSPFEATLCLGADGKVTLEFTDTPSDEVLGQCPKCGEAVKETPKAYSCSSWKSKEDPGCGFVVWKDMAQKRIKPEVVKDLLAHKRSSQPLEGFIGKSGKEFTAFLLWDEEQEKVVFDFPSPSDLNPKPLTTAGGLVADASARSQKPLPNVVDEVDPGFGFEPADEQAFGSEESPFQGE
jgi:DNA topoisomerase-3